MSAYRDLVDRLDAVRQTGQDTWTARCPAHDDKNPSLAVRFTEDGRWLLYCRAHCSISEITGALGIDLTDLFPPRTADSRPIRRPFPAADILRCLNTEIYFLHVCASDMARGEELEARDYERLQVAAQRFENALVAGGIR